MKQLLSGPLAWLCLAVGAVSTASGLNPLETRAVIHTSRGDLTFVLYPASAPITVLNFIKLSQERFYDDTLFHRVVTNFIIQGGDPLSRTDDIKVGTGGPGYCIPGEFGAKRHVRGVISMARRDSDVDSAGSQFFICLEDMPSLDGHYAAFGQLVDGWDVLDAIGKTPVVYSPQGLRQKPVDKLLVKGVTISILVPPLSPKPAVTPGLDSTPLPTSGDSQKSDPNAAGESNSTAPPAQTQPASGTTSDRAPAATSPNPPQPQPSESPAAPASSAKDPAAPPTPAAPSPAPVPSSPESKSPTDGDHSSSEPTSRPSSPPASAKDPTPTAIQAGGGESDAADGKRSDQGSSQPGEPARKDDGQGAQLVKLFRQLTSR